MSALKALFFLLLFDGVSFYLSAQSDSICSKTLLEITIHNSSDKNQIGFYQSSKLATTEDILSKMDGVNLIRRGPFGMEPSIRGYSASQINLNIDGMKMYGACTDRMDPASAYIEPINLEGISLSQGAQGNFYGSTIGGSLSLKFKAPAKICHPQLNAQFLQSYASNNNGINSSIVLEKSTKKSGIRFSSTYRKAQNYFSPKTEIQNSAFEKLNLSMAYQYYFDSVRLIRFSYLGDWANHMGYPALPMDVGNAKAHIFSLTYLHETTNLKNESKIYFNHIYHSMDDTHRPLVAMHMDMPGWSQTIGFYNELQVSRNRHQLQLRVDAHQSELKSEMIMYPKNGDPSMYLQTLPFNKLTNAGISFQYALNFKRNYYMKWSARIDYFQQWLEPGFGADEWSGMGYDVVNTKKNLLKSFTWINSKQFKNNLNLSLILGYAERIPSANERYGYYLFNPMDNYDYLGNIHLNPETSQQIELNLQQSSSHIQWSLQPFLHFTKNMIYATVLNGYMPMTAGAYGVKTYQNINSAINCGAEASFTYKFNHLLQYRGTAKYLYAESSSGMPLALIQPLKIQSAIRLKLFKLQIQLEHQFSAAQNRINTDYRERKTPAFQLWHIRASGNITRNSQTIQYAIAIENLLNTKYFEHLDIGYLPRMGRNFIVTIGYLFH
jgi:iron complex outermembrane receptor protein